MITPNDRAERSPAHRPANLADLLDADRLTGLGVGPAAPALLDGTTTLDWRTYVDRSARLAGVLLGLGVVPGDRVAVRMPKSVDAFVAVHGVIRAGGIVVPIDPLAPAGHGGEVAADAGAVVLVTDSRAPGTAAVVGAAGISSVVVLDADPTGVRGVVESGAAVAGPDDLAAADPAPVPATDPGAAAYLIYTSGSTGAPKGIVHTHASALAYATAAAELYALAPDDRLVNIAPLHFDQSTFELYAAPLVGASVLVVPDAVLRFPASLSQLVADHRATVWYSVPHVLEQLVDRGALDDRDLSSLRWILYGGESFPPRRLAELMRRLPGVAVSNVYGPAEVNQCSYHHLTAPPDDDAPIPIGTAWPAAELVVVDADDPATPVRDGEPGVLLVRSPTMMSGYWHRPDLTDRAILERTGPDGSVARWYVTGDLVVTDPEGRLVFLGRADNQVKVRGHRVELEAVDAAIADLPGVDEATVVVRRPDEADDHLVALVVGADLDPTAIRRALAARLPRYAVPTEVVVVPRLPRTGTGKIDRGAAAALLGPR